MNAMSFIAKYPKLVDDIAEIADPRYKEVIKYMKATDPHDLVGPDSEFSSPLEMRGFVLKLFIDAIKDVEREQG